MVFKAGHKIHLTIEFAAPQADSATIMTLHRGPTYPSHLTLSLID